MGSGAGYFNTTGCNNNFFGHYVGYSNTTGCNNNFMGSRAGYYNTAGNNNNFFGLSAGIFNTTGNDNNFIGKYAGFCNTTGSNNNFFGSSSGSNVTTGSCNTFIGSYTGSSGLSNTIAIKAGTNILKVDSTGALALNGSTIITATGYHIRSIQNNISANGTNQSTATILTKEINAVNVVSAGQGVRLPQAVAGMIIYVLNLSGTSMLVYPASGASILPAATNVGYAQSAGTTVQYIALTDTVWSILT
jgi:hypothetical protein